MKKHKLGFCESIHYFMPGKNLDDLALKKVHRSLIRVNEQSGSNVSNKMLNKNLSMDEIRAFFESTIVGISMNDNRVNGFLISPILNCDHGAIVHGGLIIIDKNPGENLVGLLSLGNAIMAYDRLGSYYATNISSTPCMVESFSELFPGCWPSPDVKLRYPPRGYREILKVLKEEYMDKCFPDADKLDVDYKRFILSSNSKEMGFVTDFHKVSRADNFKYNLFCHAWVNYQKEEDIIQVGKMTFFRSLRMKLLLILMKASAKKRKNHKTESHDLSNDQKLESKNKAA